jgi:oligogalacturonide lyase
MKVMAPRRAEFDRWTRRRVLAFLPWMGFVSHAVGSASVRTDYPAERVRFLDPATEFEVERLTNPEHASYLPPNFNRVISRRNNFLIYCSERSGSLQVYSMSLRNWESRQLTEAAALDKDSVVLSPDDRWICYIDDGTLWIAASSGGRSRALYKPGGGRSLAPAVSVTPTGPSAVAVETEGQRSRLLTVTLGRGAPSTVTEIDGQILAPSPRPKRASMMYRREDGSIWLAETTSSRQYQVRTEGEAGQAHWSPDGRTILYLQLPSEKGKVVTVREVDPDTREDKLLAPTTQFVEFGLNSDASVFLGASGSLAAPYMLLLIRSARRELTLCEHRRNGDMAVQPMFSPDSQRVFFQSSKHGKPAIFTMTVDKLVEKTEES